MTLQDLQLAVLNNQQIINQLDGLVKTSIPNFSHIRNEYVRRGIMLETLELSFSSVAAVAALTKELHNQQVVLDQLHSGLASSPLADLLQNSVVFSESAQPNVALPKDEVTAEPVKVANTWVQDIRDMHEKFNVREGVDLFDSEKLKIYLKFRLDMIQEELDEAIKAFNEGDADGVVDALIDNAVFTIGTLDVFHVNANLAWNRVHEKNMEKSPGVKAERPNKWGLPDLIKPENWSAPTHVDNVGILPKVFE